MDYERLERINKDLKSLLESDMASGYKDAWNAAIDECLKINKQYENPISRDENMRRLKK
jgi:hypothetical protein